MKPFEPTVVITTYNRAHLLPRAVQSAVDQHWPGLEIIVIDDASTDNTSKVVHGFPQVRYIRVPKNSGVCAARNQGLQYASHDWVLFLDDDDEFTEGALETIARRISDFPEAARYPLCQFPRSNARQTPKQFVVARLEDFLNGTVQGDFAHVFRREICLADNIAFAEDLHAGAEQLLVWSLAEAYGIPTWPDCVQNVYADAPTRMMSVRYHISRAREHAELHERVLVQFGSIFATRFPAIYDKERLAAAAYWLLARERASARRHILQLLRKRFSLRASAFFLLSLCPSALSEKLFVQYRRRVTGWQG